MNKLEIVLLSRGKPAFKMELTHYVTRDIFARSLRNFFWSEKVYPFTPKLSTKRALEILEIELKHGGRRGSVDDTERESAHGEDQDQLEGLYLAAQKWVDEHYPFLK